MRIELSGVDRKFSTVIFLIVARVELEVETIARAQDIDPRIYSTITRIRFEN